MNLDVKNLFWSSDKYKTKNLDDYKKNYMKEWMAEN